jgi:hypothetical protein
MNEIIVNGVAVDVDDIGKEQFENHTLEKVINISQSRGDSPQSIEYAENDVVEIIFEDGLSWVTPANKIQEAFEKSNRNIQVGQYVIPHAVDVETQDRGLFKIAVKTIKFFKSKLIGAGTSKLKKEFGKSIDKKLMKDDGLFLIDDEWNTKPESGNLKKDHYLLFIHGFISSFEGAFGDIFRMCDAQKKKIEEEFDGEDLDSTDTMLGTFIKSKYGSNILAFNHKTISESPILNTIDLINALPKDCSLDIIAHSRGGLIADLLSICDKDNPNNFTEEDISKLNKEEASQLRKLKQLAKVKNIKVNKVVRAGSPMNGTYLLSKNLDQFLSAVFALIELGSKGAVKASLFYNTVKSFVVSVVGSKSDAAIFPGIAAMVPGSSLLKILNDSSRNIGTPLLAIEGNAEIGKNLIHSLSVILGNILHRRANDFIVNTSSMRFGTIRKGGAYVCRTEDNNTTHFNYFCHPKSRNAVYEALKWDALGSGSIPEFEHFHRDELILQYEEQISQSRGGVELMTEEPLILEASKPADLLDLIYGSENENDRASFSNTISIKLVHGNLEFAESPVMAGHFKDQAIVSAEKTIDKCLDFSLSDHYSLGKYPNDPEDSIIIYNKDNDFKGCILMGLGEAVDFNDFKLRKAVENSVVSFALKMRDSHKGVDKKKKSSISSLCIASGFGGLNMDASLTAILFGINNANKRIYNFNKQQIEKSRDEFVEDDQFLVPITELEIVELFEHKVRDAFYGLKRIKELNYNLNIEIPDQITSYHGGLKELNTNKTQSYWYDLITKKEEDIDNVNGKMSFLASQGAARVEETVDFYSLELVTKLLESYSQKSNFDKQLSNSLFQLLLPKSLRPMLRGQHNIVWKMDKEIAHIPWEMIHDQDSDIDPTFVNSGLVRQLVTSRALPSEKITREQQVLIIGDPIYTKYSQLPGAKEEADLLAEKFGKLSSWQVTPKIRKGYVENSLALLNSKYKVLHVCGHGIYDPITKRTGLVMEDSLLDTVFFNNLENIPEMAFINCCYSGTTDKEYEKLYENRYNISASIGTQLIEMGVQAVIVTGWAVNDQAALAFADKFYEQMLNGDRFGIATKNARRHIYDQYKNKTWAAYQCYGNPWYQLVDRKTRKKGKLDFNAIEEVNVKLYNLRKRVFLKEEVEGIFEKTNKILEFVNKKWPNETKLLEKIARIYFEMDYNDEGISLTEKVFSMPSANYKVKTIEHYVYAKLKGINKYKPNKTYSPERQREERKKNKEKNSNTIEEVNKKIEILFSISDSSLRYCHRGLFHMRVAMVSKGSKIDKSLDAMKQDFEKAFYKLQYVSAKRTVFPLMMFSFANYIEGRNRQKTLNYLDESYEIKALYDKLREEVLARPSRKNNFWNDIALNNIDTSKMILANNTETDNIPKLRDRILKSYKKEFTKSGTFRNLRAEIDQYEFLSFLLEYTLKKRESVKKQSAATKKSFKLKLAAVNQIHGELLKLKNLN